jgi:hypothetical protein
MRPAAGVPAARWGMHVKRTIRELGSLAVVVGLAGAVTLYLLGANPSLGRWLLAALLLAHGWVHLMFVFPKPPPPRNAAMATAMAWPFDLGSSWLIWRAQLPSGVVHTIGRALVGIVFVSFLLAAGATAGVLVPAAWWAGLVLAGAASSALLLGIAFSSTLLLGLAIDIAVAWLAIAGPWTPAGA